MIDIYFNDFNEFKYDLISFICDHCFISSNFDNNDEFYHHVFDYHDYDIDNNNSKRLFQNENFKFHAKQNVYNFNSQNLFDYVNIEISIFDFEFIVCIDIENDVNFCDKNLFSKKNIYDIVHRIKSIIIINVAN